MTIAYFDCFAGAGGDMIVGALVDAGADIGAVADALSAIGVDGLAVRAEKVTRGGQAGTQFVVACDAPQPERNLADVLTLIESAGLTARAADRAVRIFNRLAEAEAKVHGVGLQEVHFHEIGAIDSVADVVGACVALELLEVDKICCSAIPLGSGTIECSHGRMPIPAPATAQLVVGAETCAGQSEGELTTPTAAAVLTTLAESYGPVPAMKLQALGSGAGTRDSGPIPNLLRVFVGQSCDDGQTDSVVELSANIDDCTGEMIGAAIEKLLAAGCLDAWAAPIVMKKSRPAWMLSALCLPSGVESAELIMLSETSTFGVRRRPAVRTKLLREHKTVETPYGLIRVKLGLCGEEVVTASPEFADCLDAAQAHHVPVKEVLAEAIAAYRAGRRP